LNTRRAAASAAPYRDILPEYEQISVRRDDHQCALAIAGRN
jgi:hypothetical protein